MFCWNIILIPNCTSCVVEYFCQTIMQVLHWWWCFEHWTHSVVWNRRSVHPKSPADHSEVWSTSCLHHRNWRFDSRQFSLATMSCLQITRPDPCCRTCRHCRCRRLPKIKSLAPFLDHDSMILPFFFDFSFLRNTGCWIVRLLAAIWSYLPKGTVQWPSAI